MGLLLEETLEKGSEGPEMTFPAVTAGIGSFFAALHLVFWISAEFNQDIEDCKKSLLSALLAIIFLFPTIWSLS